MTKAILCTHCHDIVSPFRAWETNRAWRWCQCDHAATRWRDGTRGLLEVAALHGPNHVRVLGVNNLFLQAAVDLGPGGGYLDEQWRALHEACTQQVAPHYLFHADRRACWALLIRPGETGDVFYLPYGTVRYPSGEEGPGG